VEVAVILFFIKALRFLTGIEQLKKEKVAKGEEKTFWEKINQFKPLKMKPIWIPVTTMMESKSWII
jgi:hypothetical protein